MMYFSRQGKGVKRPKSLSPSPEEHWQAGIAPKNLNAAFKSDPVLFVPIHGALVRLSLNVHISLLRHPPS